MLSESTKLLSCIQSLQDIDLSNVSYTDAIQLDAIVDRLTLTWTIKKLRTKSEQVINTEFYKLITLKKDNFQDLIPIKATLKNRKGIYVLSFSDGKYYVGQTNNMSRRLDEYFDINRREYKGHNQAIRELFQNDSDLITDIYFLEATSDLNLLESSYIEKLKANDPLYGYNKTGGNQ